jgi:hypothetical protein
LKENNGDSTAVDSYRGITVSCALSKVFEICMLNVCEQYLKSSQLQFGFKAGSGCRDAILCARTTIKYLNDRGNTATVAALDISKSYDKVDNCCLFLKLMKRGAPKCFIATLRCWYSKSQVVVKWNGAVSFPYTVKVGVRQGGILSPFLFAIYIDELIDRIKLSGFGVHINKVLVGCIVYADDVLLIAQSVTQLQYMLDICTDVANCMDFRFNVVKSAAMRIGSRYKKPCSVLNLDGKPIKYVDSIQYLGIRLLSGLHFKCDFNYVRCKFFRSFNAVFSKSKTANSEAVSVFLMKSFCIPVLTYSLEALAPTRSAFTMLDSLVSSAIRKIFNVTKEEDIMFIRRMFDLHDLKSIIAIKICRFSLQGYNRVTDVSRIICTLAVCDLKQLMYEHDVTNSPLVTDMLRELSRAISKRL